MATDPDDVATLTSPIQRSTSTGWALPECAVIAAAIPLLVGAIGVWLVPIALAMVLLVGSVVAGLAVYKDPSLADLIGEPAHLLAMGTMGLVVAIAWLAFACLTWGATREQSKDTWRQRWRRRTSGCS